MAPTLAGLYVYPVKSAAPLCPATAVVEPRGLRGDRRWMIVDADGAFLTGRQLPRLTLLRATPVEDGLLLEAPDLPARHLAVPDPAAPRLAVRVWNSTVDAALADPAAQDWISRFLGREARFVYMDDAARRPVDTTYAAPGGEVSFADGFPLLLISQAALDDLNARLATPVPMLHFRPNLVVGGTAPHAEDGWRRVRIGSIVFDVVKPCTRCVFTTVDPERGAFAADGEPLRTLITYRRGAKGVTFGQNLIARGTGTLCLGDPVEVLA